MSEPVAGPEAIPLSRFADGIDIRILPENALPPDLAHCLDAEVEMGGLTTDQRAYVDLFEGEDLGWFRALVHDGGPRFPLVIRARFDAWRETASPGDAMALDWAGLAGLGAQFEETSQRLARSAAADRIGGTRIGGFVDGSDDATGFVDIVRGLVGRTAVDIAAHGLESFLAARFGCAALYGEREADIGLRDAAVMEWARAQEGVAPSGPTPRRAVPVAELRKRAARARRVLTRSHSLLRSIAGAARAKAWLAGDEVKVEGRRFDFPVRVARVHHAGAGAVDVRVTDKEGVELARLCVFNPDTPALDQVSALVLHVISGEEDAILANANIIRASEAAARNAAFREVRGDRSGMGPEVIDLGAGDRLAGQLLPAVRTALAARTEREAWGPLAPFPGLPRPWDDGHGAERAA